MISHTEHTKYFFSFICRTLASSIRSKSWKQCYSQGFGDELSSLLSILLSYGVLSLLSHSHTVNLCIFTNACIVPAPIAWHHTSSLYSLEQRSRLISRCATPPPVVHWGCLLHTPWKCLSNQDLRQQPGKRPTENSLSLISTSFPEEVLSLPKGNNCIWFNWHHSDPQV